LSDTKKASTLKPRILAAAAASALVLPVIASIPAPAQAATTRQLTVTVIDRSGQPAATADVQLLNVGTGTGIDLGARRHRQLRPGTYNVAAWIITGNGASQTYTLADKIIDLTADKTVVLDARKGNRVRLSLNNPAASAETLEIAPIVRGNWAFNPTTIAPPPGAAYVVPMRSKLMALYVYSIWEKTGNTVANPSPFRYDIIRVFRGSIPNSPVISARTAQLTRVNMTVRATDADQTATLGLTPQPSNGVVVPLNDSTTLGATPAQLVSYRSPGYQWQSILNWDSPAGGLEDNDLNQPILRHRTYSQTFGSAVWAPAPQDGMFAELDGRQLSVGLPEESFPISDPTHQTDDGTGVTKLVRLYRGGQLLKQTHGDQLTVRIPDVSHQYRLTLAASRAAGAQLSTSIHGVWKFVAKGSGSQASVPTQIYGVQLLPAGLSGRNRAAEGSSTKIALRIYGPGTPQLLLLKTVEVWASANDGVTWRKIAVHRAGQHYVVSVRNGSAAGYTSLRVYVADGHGNSEGLTVIHAYGVR
jgi:hypothetical protein